MKNLFLVILIFLLSTPIWSENLTIDDLVERDNLFYKKFTNIPFSGEISGSENGKFQNGTQAKTRPRPIRLWGQQNDR